VARLGTACWEMRRQHYRAVKCLPARRGGRSGPYSCTLRLRPTATSSTLSGRMQHHASASLAPAAPPGSRLAALQPILPPARPRILHPLHPLRSLCMLAHAAGCPAANLAPCSPAHSPPAPPAAVPKHAGSRKSDTTQLLRGPSSRAPPRQSRCTRKRNSAEGFPRCIILLPAQFHSTIPRRRLPMVAFRKKNEKFVGEFRQPKTG